MRGRCGSLTRLAACEFIEHGYKNLGFNRSNLALLDWLIAELLYRPLFSYALHRNGEMIEHMRVQDALAVVIEEGGFVEVQLVGAVGG